MRPRIPVGRHPKGFRGDATLQALQQVPRENVDGRKRREHLGSLPYEGQACPTASATRRVFEEVGGLRGRRVGYAVWVGIGVVGTTIGGMALLDEPVSSARIGLVAVLVLAILGLKTTAPA